MVVVLAGLAALLGAVGAERRAGRVPGWLPYVATVLMVLRFTKGFAGPS